MWNYFVEFYLGFDSLESCRLGLGVFAFGIQHLPCFMLVGFD